MKVNCHHHRQRIHLRNRYNDAAVMVMAAQTFVHLMEVAVEAGVAKAFVEDIRASQRCQVRFLFRF